jgi:ankyrin repeat protein
VKDDVPPLLRALTSQDRDGARKLILHGAKIGEGYLHFAAQNNWPDIVELMIERGADIEWEDEQCFDIPLHECAAHGALDVARLLLARGAKVNSVDRKGRTALDRACPNALDVARLLLERGGKMTRPNTFDALVRNNIDIPSRAMNDTNTGPLHVSAANGRTELARILLDRGADIDQKNDLGQTALHAAMGWYGAVDTVRLLLDAGAHIDATDAEGRTPLHLEAAEGRFGKMEIVEALLERGARVDVLDAHGRSALQIAATRGRSDIVRALLARGASPNIEYAPPNHIGTDVAEEIADLLRRAR